MPSKELKLCPVCQREPATKTIYGIGLCSGCQTRRSLNSLPDSQIEFTTENIRDQRREYYASTIQPYRSGELSKEYLEKYGVKGINPTAAEANNAKYVWKDTKGWDNRDKTK